MGILFPVVKLPLSVSTLSRAVFSPGLAAEPGTIAPSLGSVLVLIPVLLPASIPPCPGSENLLLLLVPVQESVIVIELTAALTS